MKAKLTTPARTLSATQTRKCTCFHPFQDERYGFGNRVVTPGKGKDGTILWRCTACGNQQTKV